MQDILSYLTRNIYSRLMKSYKVLNNENDTTSHNVNKPKTKINKEVKKENIIEEEKHYIYYTKDEIFNIIESCNIDEKYKHIDIWDHIYKYIPLPEPKFKIGERCIRMYINEETGIKTFKEQTINIWACYKNKYHPEKGYFYEYMYYPASEGFAYEKSIRKLSEVEQNKSVWTLPMGMVAPINY